MTAFKELNTRNATATAPNTTTTAPANLDNLAGQLQTRMVDLDALVLQYRNFLANGDLPAAAKAQMDKSLADIKDLSARMLDAEQKMVAQVNTGASDANTVGAILTRNAETLTQAKDLQKRKGKMTIDGINARNIVSIAGMGANAPLATAQLNLRPEQTLDLLSLINWQPTTNDLVPLLRESVFDILADIVPEGDIKPSSNLVFGVSNIIIATIAHHINVTNQALADMPALAGYIEGRLAYGVRKILEYQVINGATDSFSGLLKTGNSILAVPESSASETINKAKYQAWAAQLPPEAVILNPVDWGKIEREKGADGHYIFGSPMGAVMPILWGLPVILSGAMPQGKFWMGNLSIGVCGFMRQDVMVELSTENGTNFIQNMVTVRAEMRAGFGVAVPDACVSGNLV